MSKGKSLLFVLLFALPLLAHAENPLRPPAGDGVSQGLWWLYQLQYEKARELFTQYTKDHPDDPTGYFYKMAADWWQLAQEFDHKLPRVRQQLFEDYDKTLEVAHLSAAAAKTDKEKALSYLYLGGAEGLKGRWLVTQKQWVDAYFRGKAGAKYLRRAIDLDPSLYDAYMGLGIYDYFTDTLSGVVRVLAAMFIHGDRHRGLQELQLAIDHAGRARVEAMIFLIEIETFEENQPQKALPLTESLRAEFPRSPAMHLAQIMCYYKMHRWDDVMREANVFLKRSEEEYPYYTREGVRPALYCLGVSALFGKHDPDACFQNMNRILALSPANDASRWVTFAHLRRGQVYDMRGERQKALGDYAIVLVRPNFWGSHQEAVIYQKRPYSP